MFLSTANLEVTSVFEYGLRLPDGTEIFAPETFHGRGVVTPEDRQIIVDAIRTSAQNLGISEEDLLNVYKWVVRESQVITVSHNVSSGYRNLTDPELLPVATVDSESPVDAEEVTTPAPPAPVPSAVDTGL